MTVADVRTEEGTRRKFVFDFAEREESDREESGGRAIAYVSKPTRVNIIHLVVNQTRLRSGGMNPSKTRKKAAAAAAI